MENRFYSFIKKHKLFCFVLSLTIILIPIIFLTPSKFGILQKNDAQTWVSYAGGIIGGIFTLIGVILTIEDQYEQKKEDLANEHQPYLTTIYGKFYETVNIKNINRK